MCRFVAYFGKKPILLEELIEKPKNSLINQSREAREGRLGLNADGFGLAWYDHSVDTLPGVFKSTQPAWNDNNLKHLASKLKSNCFLAHVRASTVGDVVLSNCHPFTHNEYSFVHNGTIRHFENIRRKIINELDDTLFSAIKAETDSEHFFFLVMHYLNSSKKFSLESALTRAVEKVTQLQEHSNEEHFSKINVALSDGKNLIAARYVSKKQAPLSLHYAVGKAIDASDDDNLLLEGNKNGAVIIASEPLSDYSEEWFEIPVNHYLVVGKDLEPAIKALE